MNKQTIIRLVLALVVMISLLGFLMHQKYQLYQDQKYLYKTPPPGPNAVKDVPNPNKKLMAGAKPG
jgi:hypothetical protein